MEERLKELRLAMEKEREGRQVCVFGLGGVPQHSTGVRSMLLPSQNVCLGNCHRIQHHADSDGCSHFFLVWPNQSVACAISQKPDLKKKLGALISLRTYFPCGGGRWGFRNGMGAL